MPLIDETATLTPVLWRDGRPAIRMDTRSAEKHGDEGREHVVMDLDAATILHRGLGEVIREVRDRVEAP